MKKIIFILFACSGWVFGGGPKSTFPTPRGMDAEMQNIYHDIANPVINYATITSGTIGTLIVTSSVTLKGTATNDNAAAGFIGEFISTGVVRASAITTSNSTSFSIVVSTTLTAGDWDVTGRIGQFGGTGTAFDLEVYVGTSATAADGSYGFNIGETTSNSNGNGDTSCNIPNVRLSLSANTTVYLLEVTQFTAGTSKVYGQLVARRRR